MILHYMGAWLDPETLDVGQCTMRRASKHEGGPGWWQVWMRVARSDNGQPLLVAVPVNIGGDYFEREPSGKTWGLKMGGGGNGAHEWPITPSINVTVGEAVHNGDHPNERSIWHETVKLVNVLDSEPWISSSNVAPVPGGRRVRLIRAIGRRAELRVYWDWVTYEDGKTKKYREGCFNAHGSGHEGSHDTSREVARKECDPNDLAMYDAFGKAADYPDDVWPQRCEHCGEPVPIGLAVEPNSTRPPWDNYSGEHLYGQRQLHTSALWDTPSGEIEIACAWWATPEGRGHLHSHDAGQCPWWDNCDGRHLRIKLPDNHHWDVMGRASNCTKRDDRTHRCWVISGSPEAGNLTIGKGGPTCDAGAGSIQTDRYHGMVTNGVLDP